MRAAARFHDNGTAEVVTLPTLKHSAESAEGGGTIVSVQP